MKLIFKYGLVFIIVATSITAYLLLSNDQKDINAAPIPQSFCGNGIGMEQSQDNQKGKAIYNANCAACHKLDAVSTGPALRNVATKYQKQNLKLYDYLQGKRKRLALRPAGKKIGGGLCPKFPALTNEEVASLEAYLQ